jgi:hypothetical protein
MLANLIKGRPAESQFAKWAIEAIHLKKTTGLSWKRIAEKLSGREGIKIPKSSLHDICQTWLKAEKKRSALPDLSRSVNPPQGRGVVPTHLPVNFPRPPSEASTLTDRLDESARPPKLEIKIMRNSNKYKNEQSQ